MDVNIAPDTRAALEADLAIRCLLEAKFNLDSRQSDAVITWAQSLTERLGKAILEKIGQPTTDIDIQLNVVQLSLTSRTALICFDLFLKECTMRTRRKVNRSFNEPIHLISQRGNAFYVRRSQNLDRIVARQYERMREDDKGPRPLFCDELNPPRYDNGRRVEDDTGWPKVKYDPATRCWTVEFDAEADEDSSEEGEMEEGQMEGAEMVEEEPAKDEPKEDHAEENEPAIPDAVDDKTARNSTRRKIPGSKKGSAA